VKALLPLFAALAIAGCEKSGPAPAAAALKITSSAGGVETQENLLMRWHTALVPQRFAAEYGKSETDAIFYRLECRGDVVVLTQFIDQSLEPVAGGYYDLIIRDAAGETLSAATSQSAVVEENLEMPFHMPPGTFDAVDARPNLELGVRNVATKETYWTRMNDVARDVLMACSALG